MLIDQTNSQKLILSLSFFGKAFFLPMLGCKSFNMVRITDELLVSRAEHNDGSLDTLEGKLLTIKEILFS